MLLFGRWDTNVVVSNPSIRSYVCLDPKYVPHTHGRHARRKMGQRSVNVVERLINKVMRSGQGSKKLSGRYIRGRNNCGKKLLAMRIVEKAFEIIEEKTKKNPIQVYVDALSNSAPREDVVRVQMGGVFIPVAVDVSPLRALNIAIKNIALAAFYKSFDTKKPVWEVLAEEIILTSRNDPKSFAIMKREELERIARQSR